MSDDNIVNFPGWGGDKKEEMVNSIVADDALKAALGRYKDVIIIGITETGGQCISSMPLKDAVYELSRAIHRIHDYMD